MKMTNEEYARFADRRSPRSPLWPDVLKAYVSGGLICCLGQAFIYMYKALALSEKQAGTAASVTLIFLSALLTALGVYQKLGRFAGAGTLVPITGFANSIESAALEYKAEGIITGTTVKMFTIAGPVLVFGVFTSVLYGVIYWIAMRV